MQPMLFWVTRGDHTKHRRRARTRESLTQSQQILSRNEAASIELSSLARVGTGVFSLRRHIHYRKSHLESQLCVQKSALLWGSLASSLAPWNPCCSVLGTCSDLLFLVVSGPCLNPYPEATHPVNCCYLSLPGLGSRGDSRAGLGLIITCVLEGHPHPDLMATD